MQKFAQREAMVTEQFLGSTGSAVLPGQVKDEQIAEFSVDMIQVGLKITKGSELQLTIIRKDRRDWCLAYDDDNSHGYHDTFAAFVAKVLSKTYKLRMS